MKLNNSEFFNLKGLERELINLFSFTRITTISTNNISVKDINNAKNHNKAIISRNGN